MTRGRRVRTTVLLLGLLLGGGLPSAAWAAGPWRATIVDAETREPIKGVVVLGVWFRGGCGHPCIRIGPRPTREYVFHEELVSDVLGRVEFRRRWSIPKSRDWRGVSGPGLFLFKPGYGGWWFEGLDLELEEPGGLGIAMVPLATTEAREAFLQGMGVSSVRGHPVDRGPRAPRDVPLGAIPRYEGAVNAAREAMGLPAVRFGW